VYNILKYIEILLKGFGRFKYIYLKHISKILLLGAYFH